MQRSIRASLVTVLAATALAGCNRQPAESPAPPATAATAAAASTTPVIAAPAAAGTAALPTDHATTRRYKIAINLPTLPAGEQPLADALRATADNAKREFLDALPDPKEFPEFADRQLDLMLDFKVTGTTAAFTSVRETGMTDSGGAHPIPVQGSFVFDRKAGKLVTLDDLFADPDAARKALAAFARDDLAKQLLANAPGPGDGTPEAIREWKSSTLQMLDDGVQPTTTNFSVFVVRSGATEAAPSPGLTLIFPPYQVAPYAVGTLVVEVPTAKFARWLKPAYRDAFTST